MRQYYEIGKDFLKQIEKEVGTTYYKGDYIPREVYGMLESLLYEIENLNEKIEDIIQDRNDNWKQQTVEEQLR